jgi:isopentenyl-diphosphate delta-isomerase
VAIICRGREELGAEISGLEVVLPEFRYRATDAGGVVENEVCPVYIARVAEPIRANADEIAEWAWVSLDDLAGALERTPFVFSPWMTLQLPQLLTQSTKHFGARR